MSDANNPEQGHKNEETASAIPTSANHPDSIPVMAQNLWTQQAPIPAKQLFPKEKKEWGLVEVVNSLLISLCLQLVIAMVILIQVLMPTMSRGGEELSATELAKSTEALAYHPAIIILGSLSLYLPWVFMMWYSTKYRGRKSFKKDFGIKVKWIDLPLGLVLGLALVGVVQGISWVLQQIGVDLSHVDNTAPFRNQDFFWQVILFIGLAGILGPIMEEFFFRGFMLRGFIRHFNRGDVHEPRSPFGAAIQRHQAGLFNAYLNFRNWGYKYQYVLSAIVTSIIFGFAHFPLAENMTPEQLTGGFIIVGITGMLGLVFAFVAIKTKRIGINMFAHIFYNSTVAVMALTMG